MAGLLMAVCQFAVAQEAHWEPAEEDAWEAPDGSFPAHGGCRYLGLAGQFPAALSADLERMTKRTKDTRHYLSMIPPRRDARIPSGLSSRWPRAAAASGPCTSIDECIENTAASAGVPLAELTGDAEFLRRVRLDLTGRIPTKDEVLAFLTDTTENKREALVDELLEKPEWADRWAMFFGDHFRNTWRSAQVNRYQNGRDSFHLYLLEAMRENRPYSAIMHEIVTAEGTSDGRIYPERFDSYEQHAETYQNYEGNPVQASPVGYVVGGRMVGGPIQDTYDSLAFHVARDFLGVSTLDCVLCHDGEGHLEGLSLWGTNAKRLESWELAAFFSDIPRLTSWRVPRKTLPSRPNGVRVLANYYRITDLEPGATEVSRFGDTAGEYLGQTAGGNRPDRLHSARVVQPRYPFEGGGVISNAAGGLRAQLAHHLASDPQFARATVNYIWKEFFSRGLVEPADQFDLERIGPNAVLPAGWDLQPSHPELLELLAAEFVEMNFNLKWLMREITTSQTYQRSSHYDGVFNPEYERYFVRHQAKRLSAEQIHDALITASGRRLTYRASRSIVDVEYAMKFPDVNDVPPGDRARLWNVRALLRAFLPGDRRATPRSSDGSILQALNLMNNPFVISRIGGGSSSGTLAESLDLPDDAFVANLYLHVFGRHPTAEETARGVDLLNDTSDGVDRRDRAVDLMWVLFNSTEFYVNY